MEQKLIDFCESNKLIQPYDQILVGVSGGVDSVGLLYFFSTIQKVYHLKLHCIYVDHGLRGEISKEDGQFVKRLADKLGIDFSLKSYDIKSLSQVYNLGIEEMARLKRYEAFRETIDEIWDGKGKVALAHHRQDQVETLLFRMARGTSISGMKGMSSSAVGLFGLPLVRPFLHLKKAEIISYVRDKGLSYREDESNQDCQFRRNLIRNQILPLMREVNEAVDEHLLEFASDLSELENYLLERSQLDFERISIDKSMPIYPILQYPSVVGRLFLRKGVEKMGFPLKDVSRKHWQFLYDLCQKPVGKEIDWIGDFRVYRHQDRLIFEKKEFGLEEGVYTVLDYLDKSIEIEGFRLHFSKKNRKEIENYRNDNCLFYFPYDMIDKSVKLRINSNKDRIQVYPDGKSQSIHKLYKNAKIAHQMRNRQWVIAKEMEVLLAVGLRRSQGFYMEAHHQMVLVIRIERLAL